MKKILIFLLLLPTLLFSQQNINMPIGNNTANYSTCGILKVYDVENYDTYMKDNKIYIGEKSFSGDKLQDGQYYFSFYMFTQRKHRSL